MNEFAKTSIYLVPRLIYKFTSMNGQIHVLRPRMVIFHKKFPGPIDEISFARYSNHNDGCWTRKNDGRTKHKLTKTICPIMSSGFPMVELKPKAINPFHRHDHFVIGSYLETRKVAGLKRSNCVCMKSDSVLYRVRYHFPSVGMKAPFIHPSPPIGTGPKSQRDRAGLKSFSYPLIASIILAGQPFPHSYSH